VAHESEQRHRRRLDGAAGQLLGVEPVALELQRQPLEAQELVERRPFVAQPRAALPRVLGRIEEHVGTVLCGLRRRSHAWKPVMVRPAVIEAAAASHA
jgi:hypothetical protein